MSGRSWVRGGVLLVGGFAIGLIVSVGGLVFMKTLGQDAGPPVATSMDAVELSDRPVEQFVPDHASEPDASAAQDAPATASAGIDECRTAVALGDAAVEAATVSLANWRTHYGAQIAFDRGEIDSAEAKRRWVESKAPATDDLAAYEDARAAFAAHGGCDDPDIGTLSTDVQAEASACQARARAVADVLVAAERSTQDWRDHLDMMRRRDEFPVEEYLSIWKDAVASAPGPMDAFLDAAGRLTQATPCDTSDVDAAARGRLSLRTVAILTRTPEPDVGVSYGTLGTCDLLSGVIFAT